MAISKPPAAREILLWRFAHANNGDLIVKTLLTILTLSFLTLAASAAVAGPCDYSWQSASDGSNCGGRAADQRPGGR